MLIIYIIINIYLNLEIYTFLIKDYNIKIFSLSISIKVIIIYFLFNIIILSFNNKERDYYLINNIFNTIAINIKLYLFFIKVIIIYFIIYNII